MFKMFFGQFPYHKIQRNRVCLALELVVSSTETSPDFSVQENTAEFAAVNASPLTDIGYVSVPYCSIVVQ